MINKHFIIFGLVFLLFASFGSALNLTTGQVLYFKLNTTAGFQDITGNGHNQLSNTCSFSSENGIIDSAQDCEYSENDYADFNDWGHAGFDTGYTYSFWIKPESYSGSRIYGTNYHTVSLSGLGSIQTRDYSGSVEPVIDSATGIVNLSTWTHIMSVYDGSNLCLYINNIQRGCSSLPSVASVSRNTRIGTYSTYGGYYDGLIDEYAVWNRALNSSERSFIYNSGSPTTEQQYPYTTTPDVPLLTIKANNSHTGDFLTNFTLTLPNGTTYRNETGTELYFYNITETLNATFSKYLYFNTTEEINFNQTATVVVEMRPTASQITFNDFVKDVYDNSSITNFTAQFEYIEGGLKWNVTTTNGSLGTVRTVHNATINHSGLHVGGTHNITIWANGPNGIPYYVQSKTYIVPDADVAYNDTFYLNLTKSRFLIVDKLKTRAANTTINSFEAIFDSLNSSDEQTYSTTNGTLIAYLNWSETYNITFKPTGYEFISINQTMTSNVNYSEFIYFYQLNTIILNFYDTDTLNSLNGTNVTVQFIGDTAQTNTTSTGTLQVALFSPGDYTILFDADGYRQGKYSFTLINGSSNTINLYMEYTNATQLILVTVKDKFGTPLQNAKVIKQKWVNNQWLTDEILLTDFQGRTEGYYVLSEVFYNHVILYNDQTYFGEINGDENKKVIFAEDVNNGINFNIDILGVNQLQQYQETYDISHSLTWVKTSNSSGYFRFYWTNLNGLSSVGQLIVYKGSGKTQICSETSTTATGTLFCYVNFTTTTSNYYLAQGIVDGYALESQSITLGGAVKPNWGYTGYALALIALIISFFLFLESPSIALYFGTGVFTALGVFGLIFQGVGYGFFMLIIAITYFIASIKSESGVNA